MKQFKMNERQRFSIRKFSIGAASVLLGSVFFVANPATEVQAAEAQSNVEVVNNSNENSETLKSDGQSSNVIVAPVDNTSQPQSASQGNTVKPENTKEPDLSGEVENRETEKPKAVLNTKKLEDLLSEIDKLELADYTEKSAKVLQEKVAKAKEVLVSATTQKEIDSVYNALVTYKNSGLKRVKKDVEPKTPELDTTNGKETLGKKAENTEPNGTNIAGHNHSLNGTTRAAGSGFRATPEEISGIEFGISNNRTDGNYSSVDKYFYEISSNQVRTIVKIVSKSGKINEVTATSNTGRTVTLEKMTKFPNNETTYFVKATTDVNGKNDAVLTFTVKTVGGDKTVQIGAFRSLSKPTIKVPTGQKESTVNEYLKGKDGTKPTIDVEVPSVPSLPSYAKMKVYLVADNDRDKHVYPGDEFATNGNPRPTRLTAKVDVSTGTVDPATKKTTVTIRESDYLKPLSGGKLLALTVIEIDDQTNGNPGIRASSYSDAVTVAPAKEATPVAPTVASDEANARVTVTPSADADHVEVTVGDATVVATKTGSTWSLSPAKDGVSVDPTSGVITVAHNAASAGTQVSATAKHGNSEASSSASATLPAKETTPVAPTVASDEANARVTVTPSADADHVEVTVGDATVVATKTGSTWSLSPAKDGVSIDSSTGVITVAHNAASAGTQISATAKHGNSEASSSASATLPARRYYPIPDSYNATPQPSTPTQPDQGGTETPTTPSSPSAQSSHPTAPSQPARPAPAPSSAPAQAPRVAASPSASSMSTQAPAPAQEQVDKSELRGLTQELDQRLKASTTVSDAKIDAAKAVLLDAQKALEDSVLTEQGLRTAVESVKAALDSLKDVQANATDSKSAQDKKDAKKGTEDSKDSDKMTEANSVPAGVMVVGLLALLGVIAFWLVRRKKESEIQQLSTELTKVLGQLDAEKSDKKVLAKAQKLLQETLDFVKEENGSAETEAKLVEELKAILAKLK